ncbi:MarR family winged helix-turn-helix transcriptional regulator [Sphingopyxis sp. MWB1]|uniref:MarR family winged helix-turn-helix transcriptional regulator n=1 Tax=Sphingopyxis sp. MWB1 TaxID=1537715 RepID=UPI00051A4629|nr:helix-turn-helix domain-containing protein [Sphingopyxis sp. MWB1]
MSSSPGLGTRLRLLISALDDAVEQIYREAELDFRPRFFPCFRLLMARGSLSVGETARALGVTQPAATQTLQTMARAGLVEAVTGPDRRERRYALSAKAQAMIPQLQPIWAAADRAATALDAALPHPLGDIVDSALAELSRHDFRARISEELKR